MLIYFDKTVVIDTPGGSVSLIKDKEQSPANSNLKPNIIKVKSLLANVSLFTIYTTSSEQSK